jgi:hypothetical protein
MEADRCSGNLGTPFADLNVLQNGRLGDTNFGHHMPGNITVDV